MVAPAPHTHLCSSAASVGAAPLALATLPCAVHAPPSSPGQLPSHYLLPLLACLCANHVPGAGPARWLSPAAIVASPGAVVLAVAASVAGAAAGFVGAAAFAVAG